MKLIGMIWRSIGAAIHEWNQQRLKSKHWKTRRCCRCDKGFGTGEMITMGSGGDYHNKCYDEWLEENRRPTLARPNPFYLIKRVKK